MSSFFFRLSGVILIFILLCSNNFLYPFAFLSTAKGKTIVSVFSVFLRRTIIKNKAGLQINDKKQKQILPIHQQTGKLRYRLWK
jgi:hypothetical protein